MGILILYVISLISLANSVTAGGFDGNIQYPGTGEYCTYYYQMQSYEIYDYSPSSECRACWDGPEKSCPWNCYAGCVVADNGYDYSYNLFKSLLTCAEGCMFTDACFAIDGGYFTGSGATVGDPMSCPFACHPGYVQVDFSCVPDVACLAGQFKMDGTCIPCPACDNGYWLDGCTGTNSGTCKACTN